MASERSWERNLLLNARKGPFARKTVLDILIESFGKQGAAWRYVGRDPDDPYLLAKGTRGAQMRLERAWICGLAILRARPSAHR